MSRPDAQRDPVELLAEEFAGRLRRGERPSLSEYTARHPELASEIHDLFPALVVMEQFGSVADPAVPPSRAPAPPRLGDFRIVREIGRGGMGVVYEAVQESLGRHVALKVLPAGGPAAAGAARERFRREAKAAARLHHTNIVPVFAVGEDGDTLYYAMQFIRGQGLDSVLMEVRRLRAADGTTALFTGRTTAIARRLMTGHFDLSESPVTPRPESARGALSSAPLADSDRGVTPSSSGDLAAQPEARYCREVARLGVQAAEALHYAHQQGVLHRDVKPSNLLLDAAGILWVTDFGLAKSIDSDDLTGPGDLIGTIRYMAPERFKGQAADARSDVYSLAVTLYEMLTLRPAFDDSDRMRVIERIGRLDPPRARSLAPEVPRDLDTVVHKAAARSPADRYATAQEFADDLRRFLDGRPVVARRHGWSEQAWRWVRRNPAVASLAAAVVVLLAAVAVGATISAFRLGAALTRANDNLSRAVSAETDADANRWRGHLLDARSSRLSRGPGQRIAALASLRQAVELARARGMPAKRFAEMRTEAIAALALPDLFVERWWDGRPAGTVTVSFAGDLATYARLDGDGSVSLRRVADDAELCRLPTLGGKCDIRLSPDGKSLFQFQAVNPRRGRLWDLTADPPAVLAEVDDVDKYPSYRPDGRQFAVTHPNGAITVYDAATGRILHRLPPQTLVTNVWASLHPHAPLVAVSSYFHSPVLVRDLRTGAVVARVTPPWRPGGGFAGWHPSGKALYVCQGDDAEVRLYDFNPAGDPIAPSSSPQALTYRRSFRSPAGGGTWAVFNPAGDRLVVTGWGCGAQLFDADSGRLLISAPPGSLWTGIPQFDPAGRRLALAQRGHGDGIGFWSVADGREFRVLAPGRAPAANSPAISPDGRLAAVYLPGGLALFDLATGKEVATVPDGRSGLRDEPVAFAFDPSGALLVNGSAGCYRWPLRTDDSRSGSPASPARMRLGPPEAVPFHPSNCNVAASRDGRVIAQAMFHGYGLEKYSGGWILQAGRPGDPRRVAAGQSVADVSVSPDGQWVAFGIHLGHVRVFEVATGRQVWQSPDGGSRCLFSADGRWLATDVDNCRVYSVGTWAPGPQLGQGHLASISADGRLAVLAMAEGLYRFVAIETGQELARLEDPDRNVGVATLAPDGSRLVALGQDGIRVWDLRAIRRELAAMGLDWDARPLPPEPPAATPLEVEVIGAALLDPVVRAQRSLVESTARLLMAPDDLTARLRRADMAKLVGLPWLAEHDYTTILARYPDHRNVRFERGLLRVRQGQPADALADLDLLLLRQPEDDAVRRRRGQVLTQLGRFPAALADFELLIAKRPRETELLSFRAECRDRAGDRAGAEADLALALEVAPDRALAANELAWRYVMGPKHLRDPVKALSLARIAVEQEPSQWWYKNTLGVALFRLGQSAEAVKVLTASLEHNSDESAAWDLYVLAMCYHRLGDAAMAKDCLDRGIRWHRRRTGLTARERGELEAFRVEAEAILKVAP